MPDLEKVIKGLEGLTSPAFTRDLPCSQQLFRDAIALLKAQEPRVMTLEEVLRNAQKIGFPCWVEDHIEDIGPAFLFPAVVTSDDIYVQYTGNDYYEGAIYHWAYNKRLRCWTAKPSLKQMEETPWK